MLAQTKDRRLPACVQFSFNGARRYFYPPEEGDWKCLAPHLGATENWTIEKLALMHALVRFAHICSEAFTQCFAFGPSIVAYCWMGFTHTIVNQKPFAFKNIQSEMSSGFPSHSFTAAGVFSHL